MHKAFRQLARQYHPDVAKDKKASEAKFKEINEAYEVLGDPEKRRKYDELGANWRMYEQAGAGTGPGGARGFDPSQFAGGGWNVNPGGGGAGYRTMSADEMRDMFGDANPFSDFFKTFFGGAEGPGTEDFGGGRRARRARPQGPRVGRDVEQEIELGLEDAFRGAMRRLSITHDGHARTVDVRIPAGVGEGSRGRISGEGGLGSAGAQPGDLSLGSHTAPRASF